ncbi:ribbon-helix-helix domain-containing protein [Pseudomonas sp. NA13]
MGVSSPSASIRSSGVRYAVGASLARSIRLNGFATCLRLEQVYWDILGDMAQLNSCSISTLLSHVDREVHLRHGGVRNFSALVRVVCVVHSLKETGMDHGAA